MADPMKTDLSLSTPATAALTVPRGLFAYMLLYGGMTVLAGVLAAKQVQLWPTDLAVEGGIFAFLILVVISSSVAQLYGQNTANRIVLWGFVPLAVSTGLMLFVLHVLPASSEMVADRPEFLAAFEMVHNNAWRVWLAGPCAYLVSLLLNVWIFSHLRGNGGHNTLGLMVRGAVASALSQAIDSVIFITLAFYGVFPIMNPMLGQIIAKVVLSIVLVPFLITIGIAFAQRLDRDSFS